MKVSSATQPQPAPARGGAGMTKYEVLTLVISLVALLGSGASIFFQFLHVVERADAAVLEFKPEHVMLKEGQSETGALRFRVRLLASNSGNRNVTVLAAVLRLGGNRGENFDNDLYPEGSMRHALDAKLSAGEASVIDLVFSPIEMERVFKLAKAAGRRVENKAHPSEAYELPLTLFTQSATGTGRVQIGRSPDFLVSFKEDGTFYASSVIRPNTFSLAPGNVIPQQERPFSFHSN